MIKNVVGVVGVAVEESTGKGSVESLEFVF